MDNTIEALSEELAQARRRIGELEAENGGGPGEIRRYRSLFEKSRDAIVETTPQGRIVSANTAAFELFGRSREELIGLNFQELYLSMEDSRRFNREMRSTGSVKEFETRLIGAGRRGFDCQITAAMRVDSLGEIVGFQGIIRDVSQSKQDMARLEESEEKFRSLSEYAPDIIYTLAADGSLDYVNPAWEKILGYDRSETIGRYFIDFAPPDEVRAYKRLYKKIRDDRKTVSDFDGGLIAKDGGTYFFSVSGTPRVDRSGRVIGIVGLLKDITSRRRTEEQLKIQKAYAEGLIDGAPEAIVQVDNDDRVIRINREFTRLFGYTPEEAEGRMVNDLIVPADKKDEGSDLTRRAASGERFEVEARRRTKDGRLVDVSLLATPIRTEDGQVGVFAVYRDISERKRAAEALRESEARFRELADLLPTTIAEADKDRRLVYANKMAFELFGYPEEDLEKGLYLDEVIHPDQREFAMERMARVMAGETLGPTEYRLISGLGREFPGLVTSAPIWRDGSVEGFRTTVQDLTSQKEAEEALRRSEEKYGTILEDIEDGYYELDLAGNFTYATEVTAKIVGTPRHSFLGTNFSAYCNKENAEYLFKVYHGVYDTGVPAKHVWYEFTGPDGVHKIMEASASLIRDEDGQPVGFRGIIRDMTSRIKAEEAVRESEERHRKVLETAPDPMVVRDAEGLVTYINPTFTRVFGWTLEEKKGRRLDNIPKEHMPETLRMRAAIENGESFSGIETRRLTKDGRLVDVSVSGAVFFDAQGRRRGSVTTLQDITQRKTAEAELKYVAYHDILTGLPNRKSFYMRLEDILNQSQRRLANDTWALLFLDLDKFKHINDSLGHDVGDGMLKAVARRIKACLRRSDYIFRLGGDEFTIILTNLTHDTDVAKVSRKILDSVAKPYSIKGHEFYSAASIGISVFPNDGLDVEILVKNADMAMYVAKEEGNGFRFFTAEMNVKALERIKLEGNLRNAVERGEFLLHYQPLVNENHKVMGMEALIRWKHPELGLIPPARFIGLAEETGVIISIGEWVLRTACARTKAWQLLWGRDLYIAVNLSARQFRDPLLVDTIRKVLDDTGLRPDLLRLEVTESCVMENPEDAIAKMESLRAIGIRFSIDDFGTGYSSLSYLKRFPIDTLKIDRSFVTDSMENSSDREIIKTIISMARNLHIETVAEGVETAEQQDFLCGQGCSMMQGFYFGRPMPEDEFEDLFIE